jgi:integrase
MSRVFQRDCDWWIDFKDARGVRRRKKIGPSKRVAREVLDGILGNVARRQHLGIVEESAISFADFAKEWKRRVAPTLKPRSQERWFGIVEKHLKSAFSGTLRAITQSDAEAYMMRRLAETKPDKARTVNGKESKGKRRVRGATPATVNRELTVVKHMLKRAVEWGYLGESRVAKVKQLKESPGRTRFLAPDEIGRLLAACDAEVLSSTLGSVYLKLFALLALNTGMRRNEILGLTRRAIDWQNRMATIEATKNGEARHVYLNDTAIEALRSLPARIDTDRLFPFKPNQVSMAFRRAAKRAGIEDFRLHDARHTFASYQAMAGVQPRGLQSLLGHKDGRMTMRYSHLSDAYLRAAVNKVNLGVGGSEISENGTHLAPAPERDRRMAPTG